MFFVKFGWYWSSSSGSHVFSLYCNYLPLKKSLAFHLNKLESLSPTDDLIVPELVQISTVVFEKKIEMWKFYRQKTTTAMAQRVGALALKRKVGCSIPSPDRVVKTGRDSSIAKWTSNQKSSLELSAQVS